MEDICELPTDLAISVVPHEDSWKVLVMTGGPPDADRCEMIETIADRLRIQFDLKSWTRRDGFTARSDRPGRRRTCG
jgi:hypothetical protein